MAEQTIHSYDVYTTCDINTNEILYASNHLITELQWTEMISKINVW